ncbi:hypothetical protein [Streptomyces sp. MZ04]|nr:hypothetical protein [Streptomyces sp. MZ04]
MRGSTREAGQIINLYPDDVWAPTSRWVLSMGAGISSRNPVDPQVPGVAS